MRLLILITLVLESCQLMHSHPVPGSDDDNSAEDGDYNNCDIISPDSNAGFENEAHDKLLDILHQAYLIRKSGCSYKFPQIEEVREDIPYVKESDYSMESMENTEYLIMNKKGIINEGHTKSPTNNSFGDNMPNRCNTDNYLTDIKQDYGDIPITTTDDTNLADGKKNENQLPLRNNKGLATKVYHHLVDDNEDHESIFNSNIDDKYPPNVKETINHVTGNNKDHNDANNMLQDHNPFKHNKPHYSEDKNLQDNNVGNHHNLQDNKSYNPLSDNKESHENKYNDAIPDETNLENSSVDDKTNDRYNEYRYNGKLPKTDKCSIDSYDYNKYNDKIEDYSSQDHEDKDRDSIGYASDEDLSNSYLLLAER